MRCDDCLAYALTGVHEAQAVPNLLRRLEREQYLRLAVIYEGRPGLARAARDVQTTEKTAEKADVVAEAIHLRRTAQELLVLLLARDGQTNRGICEIFAGRVGRPIALRTVATIRRSGHINPHWLDKFMNVARLADAAPRIGITPEETIRFLRGDPAWRTDPFAVADLHVAVRDATVHALGNAQTMRDSDEQLSALNAYLGVGARNAAYRETTKPERPALIFRGASDRELIALAAGSRPAA